MQLTPEQQTILQTNCNIKINAVAGSGKTTTVIEYARTRPSNSKILYLAFNRSVRLEAEKKFTEKGIKNVKVETAHSLAYKHTVSKYGYKLRKQGYKTYEIAEILGIKGSDVKHFEYILANHVGKFVSYFCNSDKKKVQELKYTDVVFDKAAKAFVKSCYPQIEQYSRLLLSKMDGASIEISHDFYLKKFQLDNPVLHYDYILFDEGQDASPAMLEVFLKQKAIKVIVGDVHQQIYGWRHAVNSLDKVDYPVYHLTNSFRFHPDIAKLSTEILEWKKHLKEHTTVKITGSGKSTESQSKAVLARTNLGLLLKAIQYVTEKKKVKRIYFEGNINSYTYADEGASLYDVLNLYNGERHRIKDKLVQTMKDISELEEYIEKTDDVQLAMMVEIVKEYGNRIYDIVKSIKEKHVPDEEKHTAEIIFSTVHRCKGMEYDSIQLADDFITEEKLIKLKEDVKEENLDKNKLNEEINLLYVAVTRTRNIIHIPEDLLPEGISGTSIIIPKIKKQQSNEPPHGLEIKSKWKKENLQPKKNKITPTEKAYSVEKARQKHAKAYSSWTDEMDDELREMCEDDVSVVDLIVHFGRTRGAIASRIKKLGLR